MRGLTVFLSAAAICLSVPAQAEPLCACDAQMSVYFSPNGGALEAILSELDGAQKSVHMQAFHLRSKPIIKALEKAVKRGLDVRVLVDAEDAERSNSRVRDAAAQGIPVYSDGSHSTAHNKVVIVDGSIVITGSYNFTNKAETQNSENLLVIRSKELAGKYEKNWENHFSHSKPFK